MLPLAFISGGEGLVIFFAILMLFGAKKLPELARGLGSAIREFSKAKDEVEREITRPPTVYEPRIEAPPEMVPHIEPAAQTEVADPHAVAAAEHAVAAAEHAVAADPYAPKPVSPQPPV